MGNVLLLFSVEQGAMPSTKGADTPSLTMHSDKTPPLPRHSAANYVKPPPKIHFLVKLSHFYATRIPMGVREFVFTGPLLLVTFAIAFFIPSLVPVEKFTQGLTPHTQDMREYTLEPMYDGKGQLNGYRHINNRGVDSGSAGRSIE